MYYEYKLLHLSHWPVKCFMDNQVFSALIHKQEQLLDILNENLFTFS